MQPQMLHHLPNFLKPVFLVIKISDFAVIQMSSLMLILALTDDCFPMIDILLKNLRHRQEKWKQKTN